MFIIAPGFFCPGQASQKLVPVAFDPFWDLSVFSTNRRLNETGGGSFCRRMSPHNKPQKKGAAQQGRPRSTPESKHANTSYTRSTSVGQADEAYEGSS
ncbi:hypothetical protein N7465_004200 [Penicillium sp. CMV-2018d]|nr:hypothetical protein N7465_004200 [Penicillium sp. CMV-2018d]